MKDISITYIDQQYLPIYKAFFQSMFKINKYFSIKETDKIFLVNNGSVDIGVIVVDAEGYYLDVHIYQAPKVCRLSIISLIECGVLVAKKEATDVPINFKLNNATSYNFKFKIVFPNYEEFEDCIRVSPEVLKELSEDKITNRDITFSEF